MIFLPTWGLVILKYILDIEVVYQKIVISTRALISINILSIIVMLCSVSVSYTHLDVYKRQELQLSEVVYWA